MAILVIGASGKTGRAVTKALVRRGAQAVAAIRPGSPAGPGCRSAGATAVVGLDLHTGVGVAEAMAADIRAVYHLAPNVDADEVAIAHRVLEAAVVARVDRFVYHSVLHPDDATMPHHLRKAAAEHLVRQAFPDAVVLRPAAYLENLVPAALAGELTVPYRLDAPFTNVALDDVADVAASALVGESLAGRTLDLAGPQRLTTSDLGRVAAEVLGHGVPARRISMADWAHGPGAGLPESARADLLAMFAAYDRDGLVGDGAVLRSVLAGSGQQPRTWVEVLRAAMGPRGSGNWP